MEYIRTPLRTYCNFKIERERHELIRRFERAMRKPFQFRQTYLHAMYGQDNMELLLADCMQLCRNGEHRQKAERFIEIVASTGYKDQPVVNRQGRAKLRRTTPIHRATKGSFTNDEATMRKLFEIYDRFDLDYLDERSSKSHFQVACEFGLKDIVWNFIENCKNRGRKIDRLEGFADPPLHLAVANHKYEVVQLLLMCGADPNLANYRGVTPLHRICSREGRDGHARTFFQMCDELDEFRIKINARDMTGATPLQLALLYGLSSNARELVKRGADPNLANYYGVTPLHCVAMRASSESQDEQDNSAEEFLRAVEEAGKTVPMDVRNGDGRTPLHCVLHRGKRIKMMESLLKRGANPNLPDEKASSPLHIISKTPQSLELAQEFYRTMGELNLELRVDARDGHGRTPLHSMCRNPFDRDDQAVKTFFAFCDERRLQVPVDARDETSMTALQWAVTNFKLASVDALLEHGADLSGFVFPTLNRFNESLRRRAFREENFQLTLAAGLLAVVERLEKRDKYKLDRTAALTIMALYAENELFVADDKWYEDEQLAAESRIIEIKPGLSLYELLRLRPKELEARGLRYTDYMRLAMVTPTRFGRKCLQHMSEKLSTSFFQAQAVECMMKMTGSSLDRECCQALVKRFVNRDLHQICLAATIQ